MITQYSTASIDREIDEAIDRAWHKYITAKRELEQIIKHNKQLLSKVIENYQPGEIP